MVTQRWLVLGFGFLALIAVSGQEVVDQLIDPHSLNIDGGTLTIVFDDLRPDTSNTHFEAEHSDNISNWIGIAGATVSPHATITDRYVITAPDPGGERKFYRIVGYSTSAEDSDGDGLSNAFEATLGTNVNLFDSDGDGFSDGVEFATGTDPDDAEDFPDQAHLPIIGFSSDVFMVSEGDDNATITINTGSFNGPITYTVAPELGSSRGISTAKFGADEDHTLLAPGVSATVMGTGGEAVIVLPLVDDLDITPSYRMLFIDLLPGPGYRRGGFRRASVLIEDNDAFWSGRLLIGETERNIRVELLRQGGTPQAWLVAGGAYDGLPNADGLTTSNSEGVFPQGRHLASSHSSSSTSFELSSPNLAFTVPTEEEADVYPGLFGQETLIFQRQLTLTAATSIGGNEITPISVFGTFSEVISASGAPHLTTTDHGTFILLRDITLPPGDISLPDLVAAP